MSRTLATAGASAGRGKFLRGGFVGIAATAAAAAPRIEHGEIAAEALQHHFGAVALLAGIVGPFARLERALDIDLRALLQILLDDLDELLVEDHDAVPLGALLALTAPFVAPALRGGDGQIRDAHAVLSGADLRIPAEIADENYFIDASGHGAACLPLLLSDGSGAPLKPS